MIISQLRLLSKKWNFLSLLNGSIYTEKRIINILPYLDLISRSLMLSLKIVKNFKTTNLLHIASFKMLRGKDSNLPSLLHQPIKIKLKKIIIKKKKLILLLTASIRKKKNLTTLLADLLSVIPIHKLHTR